MEQSVQEMKLPPIFERHQRDLIALLQRPVVHGGAGLSQQAAAEAYRSTVVDLTKDVNKALQTHRFLTDPVVFHMHVCTVLWELTSMSARFEKSPFLSAMEEAFPLVMQPSSLNVATPYDRKELIQDLRTVDEHRTAMMRQQFRMELRRPMYHHPPEVEAAVGHSRPASGSSPPSGSQQAHQHPEQVLHQDQEPKEKKLKRGRPLVD